MGPEDLIGVRDPNHDEYGGNTRAIRIDSDGDALLPLLGKVHAAGFTVERVEELIAAKLSRLTNRPDVSIVVKEFAGQRRG